MVCYHSTPVFLMLTDAICVGKFFILLPFVRSQSLDLVKTLGRRLHYHPAPMRNSLLSSYFTPCRPPLVDFGWPWRYTPTLKEISTTESLLSPGTSSRSIFLAFLWIFQNITEVVGSLTVHHGTPIVLFLNIPTIVSTHHSSDTTVRVTFVLCCVR